MCGVIGVSVSESTEETIAMVLRLFHESQIRGKHATGAAWVKDEKVRCTNKSEPAETFVTRSLVESMIDGDGSLTMIGHTRYSTSDLRYNQPIFDSCGKLAIVHNGVISQDPKNTWKYPTDTANDSELVLRSLLAGMHPLEDFPDASMAVVTLNHLKKLTAFRNTERPLWYTNIFNGVVFTSTRDISVRANVPDVDFGPPKRCSPNAEYSITTSEGQSNLFKIELEIDGPEDLQP